MSDPREIEALCAEAEGLDESGTLHPVYPVRVLALRMAATLRALAAQLAAARADSERLDWLERQCTLHTTPEFLYVVDGYQVSLTRDGRQGYACEGDNLRAAIDVAIDAAKGGA